MSAATFAKARPEDYGYIVVQVPNGRWLCCDPLDDQDGFCVQTNSEAECISEWREWMVDTDYGVKSGYRWSEP